MNIAQSAKAFFEIWLEQEGNFACSGMAVEHASMEVAQGIATTLTPPCTRIVNALSGQAFIASNEPRCYQCSGSIKVCFAELPCLFRRAYRVANFETKIPQRVPQRRSKVINFLHVLM